jgi:hypothetical protein
VRQPAELQGLWADLASDDGVRAYRAMWATVAAAHHVVPFLGQRLRPVQPADKQRLARLIADLDSDRFAVRDQAAKELERFGELAEPALRQALQVPGVSLELRRRLEPLLAKLLRPVTDPQQLQALRAIEALEHIGTVEARRVLVNLAKGAPEARVTQEANAALERLAKRSTTIR